MNNTAKVIDIIVKNDLCIGCGLCVYKCPSKAITMNWNEYGFLIPILNGKCDGIGDCITVCPFNPDPENEVKTENELATLFTNDVANYHPKIGKYKGIYAGYAEEFRLTSSSGGIATFIFTELLEKGIVDNVFSVKESKTPGVHYAYAISNNKQELLEASKTKYYPVTLSTVFSKINEIEGKVAIVGVACFIKAIRLAQYKDPILRDKISFMVGIICGGVKSRFYTEYLASRTNVLVKNIQKPQYRIKDLKSNAGDYSFGCYDTKDNQEKTIKMQTVGDMWGSGLFKANACDFCDDVTTELADISIGDAWLKPYVQDGKGTNVIVTRSLIAEELLIEGKGKGKLSIEELPIERFLASQQGSFNHRHIGLSVRLKQRRNKLTPVKRFGKEKVVFHYKFVQLIRMKVRRKSLDFWKKKSDIESFNEKINFYLKVLRFVTKVNHYIKSYTSKSNKAK